MSLQERWVINMDLYLKVKDWDIKSYQMGNIEIKDKVINLRQKDCDFAFVASQLNKTETTELEKQFFKTFGIEPKTNREYGYRMAIYNEEGTEEIKFYPEITDRHYLELICIINKFDIYFDYFYQEDYRVLKETILEDCINLDCKLEQERFNKLKHQVQELFKGEE